MHTCPCMRRCTQTHTYTHTNVITCTHTHAHCAGGVGAAGLCERQHPDVRPRFPAIPRNRAAPARGHGRTELAAPGGARR